MSEELSKEQLEARIAKDRKTLQKIEKDRIQKIKDVTLTSTEEGKLIARKRENADLLNAAKKRFDEVRPVYESLQKRIGDLMKKKEEIDAKIKKYKVEPW